MPHERRTPLRTGAVVPPRDMVTDLVAALADALRLKPEKIDPEQTFRSLGVDSLLTVEFVATVNARYGTAVKASVLLDHPTPLDFARHMARELGVRASQAAESPSSGPGTRAVPPTMPWPVPVPVPAPASVAGPAPLPGGPVAAPAPPGPGARMILDLLREELARLLCCDPWDIDPTAAFGLLGVDSIIGAQFVAVVNRTYGMSERAVTLYDHPDLAALASHIASHIASADGAPAPVQAPVTAVSGAAAPETEPLGVRALLDAVRDDRLTIDEALTLLPGRA
ncbi:acyl carrier protein [Streptomyces sp. 840.1]|uniref:acyl carrier protein n=1 Tax=Streptomyces sp. 840.1 TaxID=2485152 RepID=UPI000FA25C21|nr:acyl carrier protein [Streptomyces sp. 840.1]ROQ57464.1 acyl carrier protein [Streptomyces sp. 840.1]